jgi:hypothetical protein
MSTTNIGGVELGSLILGASQSSVIERSVTSTLTLTQAIAKNHETVQSTLTFNQTATVAKVWGRSVTSTLALSQIIKLIKPETVTSTITFSQNIVYEKTKPRTVSQSLTFSQTVDKSFVGSRLVVQGINWSHVRAVNGVFSRAVSQVISPLNSIIGQHCNHVPQTLTLTQAISFSKLKHVRHQIELQQSFVSNVNYTRAINTILGLSQQFNKTTKYNRTVSHNLVLSQAIVQARVKGVSQTLSLTQTIVANAVKNVKNTLSWSQTVAHNKITNRTVTSVFTPEQETTFTRSMQLSILHGFGMNSFVRQWRVNTRAISQNYTPTQQVRFLVYARSVTSSLTLGQTVAYKPVYPRAVTSALGFNQTVGVNKVLRRSVSNSLLFLPSREVYVGMGNVEFYEIPSVQYSVVPAYLQGKKNRPHCVLQTTNAAITLPAPEWGDGENYGGVFTIRRSMNNVPYTYVRRLSLRKLQLPWVLAKRKAWELREFLIGNNDKLMTLTTWKGDKWFVNLITNPMELSVRGRYDAEDEKVSIELEFEGLKVM